MVNHSQQVPGPEYELNLYNFNSQEERNQFFSDKKSRFKTNIFINKRGPILHEDKITKNAPDKTNIKKPILNMNIKVCLYNKPINGYSFGVIKGQLNLIQKRKYLRSQ